MHQKQLNRYLFIPQLSFHTESQHRAWIKAELLRFMRNTSDVTDYKHIRALFVGRLIARGFNRKFIRSACNVPFAAHTNRDSFLSLQQRRQDEAYANALRLVDRYPARGAPFSLYDKWRSWHTLLNESVTSGSVPGTPWPGIEQLLLSKDLVLSVKDSTIDHLFGLFQRDVPPPAFFLPLTRESAGLTWRAITLTPPNLTRLGTLGVPSHLSSEDGTYRLGRVLLVLRRPPSLGLLLRFKNPAHDKPEVRDAPARDRLV